MTTTDFIGLSKKKVEEWRALQEGEPNSDPKWLMQIYNKSDLECVQRFKVFGKVRNPYNIHEDPLYWLESRGVVRRHIINIIDDKRFDAFILTCIIINCLVEVLNMPAFKDENWASFIRYWSELLFLVIFSAEVGLKVLGLGLVFHRNSYLRSYANLLDVSVVVGSFISLVVSGGSSSFTVVRFVRIIRPLRTIRAVKGLRILILTIQNALAPLFDVMSLMLVVVFTFAVLGVQLWNGKMHQRCYAYELIGTNGTVGSNYSLVLNDTAYPCGGGRDCEPLIGFDVRCEIHTNLFEVRILHFDNIFSAIFMVIRVVTLDDWPDEMFTVQDASHNASWIYFVLLTLAGGYFLLHMMVAVLSVTYAETIRSLDVSSYNILPLSMLSSKPMPVGLHHHFLPKNFVRTRRGERSKKNDLAPVTATNTHNRAEDVVARYFGKRQFLEEYLKDCEELRRKEQEISQWDKQVHELEAALYEGAQFARRGVTLREIPQTLCTANLLGLDIFQVLGAIAFPVAMIPSEASLFEVGYAEIINADNTAPPSSKYNKKQHKWYTTKKMKSVASTRWFSIFMFLITTISVVALSTDYYGISDEHENLINYITITATGFFIAEVGLKISSQGFNQYFKEKLNILDCCVTLISIPEFFISSSPWISSLRAVRVLKLLSYTSKSQRNILSAVAIAWPQLWSLCILIVLFVYLYALIGVTLFEGKLPIEERTNFNSFWEAAVSTFIMLTGDGWTTVTREGMQGAGTIATVYFTTLFFFGSVILMSLFQAILIDAMTENARLQQSSTRKEAFNKLEGMGLITRHNGSPLVTKLKPQYSAYQRLGNWKAEISEKYLLPYWFNRQTNEQVWYNPVAPSNAGGGGGNGSETGVIEETISWDPTRYDTNTVDVSITHLKPGEPVEIWSCGNWYPASILGRREDGYYSVYYPDTGEVTIGIHPSCARPRKVQQNPLSITYSQNPLNGDNDFGQEIPPAVPLLESLSLYDALIQPELGGLTLLWCALSVSGRWKLQEIWGNQKKKTRLLQHLSSDGTLDRIGQPDVGNVINPIELLFGVNRAIAGSKIPILGRCATSCVEAARLSKINPAFHEEPKQQSTLKGMQLGGGGNDDDDNDITDGTSYKSLGFITRDNPVRLVLTSIVLHKYFDDVMLVIIFINAIFLALDDYYVEERPGGKHLLEIGNLVFVVIFLLEMISKIIVLGLFKAPRAYLREPWNVIDAVVATAQLLEVVHSAVGTQFRAMRTIRLLVRFPSIRVVCTVLLKVLPNVVKVSVVGVLLWVIFGIIGVSSFKGKMYGCNDTTILHKVDCIGMPFFLVKFLTRHVVCY